MRDERSSGRNQLDVGESSSSRIVQAIIRMANSLEMGLIAEGIETGQQRQRLQTMGREEGQGYLFSPPICAEELKAMLAQGGNFAPQASQSGQVGKKGRMR